jgi:hypothetical protein
LLKKATEMPMTMLSWLNDTRRPRDSGGAISAMYIGAIMSAAPTPSPPNIRATTSHRKLGASAEAIADIANRMAAILSTGRRPMRSLRGPDNIIASVAVSANDDTDQPTWILVSENSTSMKPTTPEITDASKPIRNPPSATNSATVAVYREEGLIVPRPT